MASGLKQSRSRDWITAKPMVVKSCGESKRLTPEADIDTAEAFGWKHMPDGEIKISTKVKKSRGCHAIASKRTVVAANDNLTSGSVVKTESPHVKITDEILNEHIDAKPILAELWRSS